MMKSVAVIGNGPIGASVARSLALRQTCKIDLFSSPNLWSAHDDVGRISRVLDFEHATEWSKWNRISLSKWREIESESGIQFFTQCGSLVLAPEQLLTQLEQQLEGCAFKNVSKHEFNNLSLGSDAPQRGLLETEAGYVNPRELIAAQNSVFVAHQGTLLLETVSSLEASDDGIKVSTTTGESKYDGVVLCGGAFCNSLLATLGNGLGAPLPYNVSRRTVLLGRVCENVVNGGLRNMPAIKITLDAEQSGSEGSSIRDKMEAASAYILPPIWYAEYEGYYLKIGGGPNDFINGGDLLASVETWRTSEGNSVQIAFLKDMVSRVLPNVEFLDWREKNCITTSAGDAPLFRDVRHDGRLVVVANCQGKACMASAAIGDEVADLVLASLR